MFSMFNLNPGGCLSSEISCEPIKIWSWSSQYLDIFFGHNPPCWAMTSLIWWRHKLKTLISYYSFHIKYIYMKLCRVIVEGKAFLLKYFFFIMADIFDDVSIFLFFRKMLMSEIFYLFIKRKSNTTRLDIAILKFADIGKNQQKTIFVQKMHITTKYWLNSQENGFTL